MTTITLVYDFKVNQENFDNLLEMAAYIDGLGQFIDEWDWDTSYKGIRNITGKMNV